MSSPVDLLETLDALDLEAIASESLQENENVIADLNATQLSQGERSDGTDITPDYADLTVELKKGKSGLAGITDRVTLFDTGSHYRQLYADVEGKGIEFGSKDSKSEKLQDKYGDNIYGLNDDSKDELAEGFLNSTWQQKIEQKTGLTFK